MVILDLWVINNSVCLSALLRLGCQKAEVTFCHWLMWISSSQRMNSFKFSNIHCGLVTYFYKWLLWRPKSDIPAVSSKVCAKPEIDQVLLSNIKQKHAMLFLIPSESTSYVRKENDRMNTSACYTSQCEVWAGSLPQNHPFHRSQLCFSAKSCSQAARCLLTMVHIC